MNRTATSSLLPFVLTTALALGQGQEPAAKPATQEPAIEQLVDRMRAAEAKARRIHLELSTEGRMPGDLTFRTKGSIRVLRSEQGEVTAVHSVFEYSFTDGLSGRMESLKNQDGVLVLEQNPSFGEVFVRIDPALVQDLEWAGKVLQRSDLPGLGDARAMAPLGSELVADLARRYTLALLSHKDRSGQEGTWFGGDRRTGLDGKDTDPDEPIADRVELFVRDQDAALLEVTFLQAGKVVQRIQVDKLVIGEAMPIASLTIDAHGLKPKDVREHQPAWEQIQQILRSAKSKAPPGELPPSERREKTPAGQGR